MDQKKNIKNYLLLSSVNMHLRSVENPDASFITAWQMSSQYEMKQKNGSDQQVQYICVL